MIVSAGLRGHLKQTLIRLGFPVEDRAGYRKGKHLDINIRSRMLSGEDFAMSTLKYGRPSQVDELALGEGRSGDEDDR